MSPEIILAIQAKAAEHRIATALLAAFCQVESSGDPGATRYEPSTGTYVSAVTLSHFAILAGVTPEVETREQMTSWGLMQVMGFNIRLLGFKGPLTGFCQPDLGLEAGACWLKHLQVMFSLAMPSGIMDIDDGSLACSYNHGRPKRLPNGTWVVQAYADAVQQAYDRFKAQGL